MTIDAFLREYLYGVAANPAATKSRSTLEPAAIAGRRAPAHLARRFDQILRGVMAEALEPYGLTSQQWGVIVAIAKEPGTDQKRVSDRQGIDTNTASRVVDELETLGLVRRMASPDDRRAHWLQLTPAGVRLRFKAQAPVIAAQDRVLSTLSRAEKQNLLDLLTRVVQANPVYARPGGGRRRPQRRVDPTPARTA